VVVVMVVVVVVKQMSRPVPARDNRMPHALH